MANRDGKNRFWKIMYEDDYITQDEYRFLLEYKKIKEQLEKEI